ncbi:GFA family protein [Cupriavidus necator]
MVGGCHCGRVRYRITGMPRTSVLCHCSDCRRHAGAPMVGWAIFAHNAVKMVKGEAKIYASSEHGRRHFCPDCGTGLFYTNDSTLPGLIDVQSVTLDDPSTFVPEAQIQTLDRIRWMVDAHQLPAFERYPPQL